MLANKTKTTLFALAISISVGSALSYDRSQVGYWVDVEYWFTAAQNATHKVKNLSLKDLMEANNLKMISDYSYAATLVAYLAYLVRNDVSLLSKEGAKLGLVFIALGGVAKLLIDEQIVVNELDDQEYLITHECEAEAVSHAEPPAEVGTTDVVTQDEKPTPVVEEVVDQQEPTTNTDQPVEEPQPVTEHNDNPEQPSSNQASTTEA